MAAAPRARMRPTTAIASRSAATAWWRATRNVMAIARPPAARARGACNKSWLAQRPSARRCACRWRSRPLLMGTGAARAARTRTSTVTASRSVAMACGRRTRSAMATAPRPPAAAVARGVRGACSVALAAISSATPSRSPNAKAGMAVVRSARVRQTTPIARRCAEMGCEIVARRAMGTVRVRAMTVTPARSISDLAATPSAM